MDAYFGKTLEARSITISGNGSTVKVEPDKAIRLAYGEYTIEVSAPGAALATLRVTIDQAAQVVTVGMKPGRMSDIEPPPCSIVAFTTAGLRAVRVRAVQLFGPYITDVPVDAQRRFEIRELACGDYLLIAMGTEEFLGTAIVRAVTLPSHDEIKFALSGQTR
jgi:hypothetical protein